VNASRPGSDSSERYSVVIPVYNAAGTLPRVIAAIEQLVPRPSAIYMVDDASTDQSVAVARAHPQVTCIPLGTNGGPGRARNAGVQRAATELLLMLDSDCYIDAAGFVPAYERMVSDPGLAGIMGVPVREIPPGPFAGRFKNYWYHLEFLAWGNPPRTLYGSCFFIRRSAYLAVDGFDESFGRIPCEDAEFYFRLVQAGYVFERRMDFAFVHDKQMTTRQLLRTSFERSVSIIQNMHGKLGKAGQPWRLREQALWAAEIGSGTFGVVGFPAAVAAAGVTAWGGSMTATSSTTMLFIGLWLASVAGFLACIRDKIVFALRDKGLGFASKAFLYRMLEMPVVAFGIAWGILTRNAAKRPT
jgi:GT2 family glycosyltransferase